MSGKKKMAPQWRIVLEGLGLSLGLYLAGQMILALLLVKGVVGEGQTLPLLALCCGVSVLGGGFFVVRHATLGPLSGALCLTGSFALVLLVVGVGAYGRLSIFGSGGVLLGVIMAAGVVTGLLGIRRPHRGRGRKRG